MSVTERCQHCPLNGQPESLSCPGIWEWKGWCGHARKEAALPAEARFWTPEIVVKAGQPRPKPRPTPAPKAFPRADAPDGRVRFAIFSPCDGPGGAEQWVTNILEHFDRSRLRCDGIAIRHSAGTAPNRREEWGEHAPVAMGVGAMREIAGRIDLLLTWGVINLPWAISPAELREMVPSGLPVISCSQGSTEYPEGEPFDTIDVAVSKAALRGIPASRRDKARIIYNGAPASRIANGRPHDEIKAEWGVPADAKVVGWMGRLSPEKGYLRFIEGVAALPHDWFGVMCGSGFEVNMAEAKWLADKIAPGRVKFVGYCQDVGDALATFDCLLMASDTEGCSLSASEAMRAGCPLVTTPVGLYEDHPEFGTMLPMYPTGPQVAAAVLWNYLNEFGTARRVAKAKVFADAELSMETLGQKWSDLMMEVARVPVAGPELCDCGDGVWVGSAKVCDEQHGKFDRIIHVWRDDAETCANHIADAGNMIVHWKEFNPVEPIDMMRPSLAEVAAFAKVRGRLLVHCKAGMTRSPTLALAAKIARGCDLAKAEADIRAAFLRDRPYPVGWHEHLVRDLVAAMTPKLQPVADGIRLARLRKECPHGSKAGCSCQDKLKCALDGEDKTRQQCYDCLSSR